jgi:hypothetical protein
VRIDPKATPDGEQPANQAPKQGAPPQMVALPLAVSGLLLLTFANRNRLKKSLKK